jgi:2,3-bisphosphoglycerate-dependent phosphoglycerate mutase
MAKLILVRHGKSEWNKQGLWTGWTDVDLAEEGHEEARKAGELIRDIDVQHAHVSNLKRTHQTLDGILASLGKALTPKVNGALNERHYGIHTGKNKWEVKEAVGEEMFNNIRRGWDVAIPEGETLKDVHARVVPHYESEILPSLKAGEHVLVVAHGNTLRALIKHLDGLDEEGVCEVEVGTGEVHCYEIDDKGAVSGKEVRNVNENKLKT